MPWYGSLWFIPLGGCSASRTSRFKSFIKFWKLLTIIFSNILSSPFSPSGTFIIHILVCLMLSTGLLSSVHFPLFFFISAPHMGNLNWPILKSADFFFSLLTSAAKPLQWILNFSYCTFPLQNFYLVPFKVSVSFSIFSIWWDIVFLISFSSSSMVSFNSCSVLKELMENLCLVSPISRPPWGQFL